MGDLMCIDIGLVHWLGVGAGLGLELGLGLGLGVGVGQSENCCILGMLCGSGQLQRAACG